MSRRRSNALAEAREAARSINRIVILQRDLLITEAESRAIARARRTLLTIAGQLALGLSILISLGWILFKLAERLR